MRVTEVAEETESFNTEKTGGTEVGDICSQGLSAGWTDGSRGSHDHERHSRTEAFVIAAVSRSIPRFARPARRAGAHPAEKCSESTHPRERNTLTHEADRVPLPSVSPVSSV